MSDRWMLDRKREIQQIVRKRDLGSVLHFTQISNLPSIIELGILPIHYCLEGGLEPDCSDGWRNDDEPGATSVSISGWNHVMLANKKKTRPSADWVVLAIDSRVLWERNCRFCHTNAASNEIKRKNKRLLQRSHSLEAMFPQDDPGSPYPSNVQAEVLVFGDIPSEWIQVAIIENRHCSQFVEQQLGRLGGEPREIVQVKSLAG